MPMQKKQIVQAALTLLDRDGLDGVTLRRLATELNIKAASIYWHIPSKVALLDEMANAILEQHFGAFDFENDRRDWAEWMETLACELRTAMLAHREGARVVAGAHPDIAIVLIKLWDLSVRVLYNSGFSYREAIIITVTLINFTFGSVIEEQSSPPEITASEAVVTEFMALRDQFSAIAASMEAWEDEDADARFGAGVQIIIRGVRAQREARSADAE